MVCAFTYFMHERRRALRAFLLSFMLLGVLFPTSVMATGGRATETWSGDVTLSEDYTVSFQNELIVLGCTDIQMSSGVRIYVEGKLTIQGTDTCPVTLNSDGIGGDHEGIQFNASSRQSQSRISFLEISNAIYGITAYDSDPQISNLTIINPDNVGIDLFDGADPILSDLEIFGAGQDVVTSSYWRHGIGLSIGDESHPLVERATFSQMKLRAINVWGNSGGVISDVSIDNITGSILAVAAGVWVEDSSTNFSNLTIQMVDQGIIVQHFDDQFRTTPYFNDVKIMNATYRGLLVEKSDHQNYTNYLSAQIDNLEIWGTGSSNSLVPGAGLSTIEVNASGARISNAHLESNDAVGLQLYLIDSYSHFDNFTIINTGKSGAGAHSAGVAISASFFGAPFNDFEISGSPGPGIHTASGGGMLGNNWYIHNNSEDGVFIERSTVVVDNFTTAYNLKSGAHVFDARFVTFDNLISHNNSEEGLYYLNSNDIESSSGDVSCWNCTVFDNNKGVIIEDSVDIWFENLKSHNPQIGAAVSIDNSGFTGIRGGRFHFTDTGIWSNNTAPAFQINAAEGVIDGLFMNGTHQGFVWDGDHNLELSSEIHNVRFTGSECGFLSNHSSLHGSNNIISAACGPEIRFENVQGNFSGLYDEAGSTIIEIDELTQLHLYNPSNLALNSAVITTGGKIDIAYDIDVHVKNGLLNGIPNAMLNLSFSPEVSNAAILYSDWNGLATFSDHVTQTWTSNGAGPFTEISLNCSYDGESQTINRTFNSNIAIDCVLPIENQPPFIIWESPSDAMVYSSRFEVLFDASQSWDLDDDPLTFSWTSSVDADLISQCVPSPGNQFNGSIFTANIAEDACLSDGIHVITLEICDDHSHCVQESRTIELSNQPPVVLVNTIPELNSEGKISTPASEDVFFDLSGIFDAEGDTLTCTWDYSEGIEKSMVTGDDSPFNCSSKTLNFAQLEIPSFNIILEVCDVINPCVSWQTTIDLVNQMPTSEFEVIRSGNKSKDIVTLQSLSVDPEGDTIQFTWHSDKDGILGNESNWQGLLTRGLHEITLHTTDDDLSHLGKTTESSKLVYVESSLPIALMSSPTSESIYDTSTFIQFSSAGSGDWDQSCALFSQESFTWVCNPDLSLEKSESLSISWQSQIDGGLMADDGEQYLFYHRLSQGIHEITMTISDGINDPQILERTIEVGPSAPVLGLTTDLSKTYSSAENIPIDARLSEDFDGDTFTFSLENVNTGVKLFKDADPGTVQYIQLPAGMNELEFVLTDETGLSRVERVFIEVDRSDPVVSIDSPQNGDYFPAGELIFLNATSSFDADGDIRKREWRVWESPFRYDILTSAYTESVELSSGQTIHLSFYIEDMQGGFDQKHINITTGSSQAAFSNLSVIHDEILPGEEISIFVNVVLIDSDGTAQTVSVILTQNGKEKVFELEKENEYGLWKGELVYIQEGSSSPFLKIQALEADGNVEAVKTYEFVMPISDEVSYSVVYVGVGFMGLLAIIFLVFAVILRKRRILAEMEVIDDWGVFANDESDAIFEN